MTATRTPGLPVVEDGMLLSTNPATGAEVGRFPVASADDVAAAVARAREAGRWWASLGFAGRRQRLLRFRSLMANRLTDLAKLMHDETGKPVAEAIVEAAGAIDHVAWAARNARRVLGPRRVSSSLMQAEYSSHLEYLPYGVVGVIGPWNYPVLTPLGSIGYALAAGNAVVFKPSEYTPAVGQWLVDVFAEVVPEQPVLQVVHGTGEVGSALCRSGVDKLAFTGSTRTGKKVMAACAETLTPVLLECGGKDAMIVDADADVDAAVDACVWGGMTNAGQTCVGIERVYVADAVYDEFLPRLVERAGRLKVGTGDDADIGPITMPGQIDVIRRHISDAIARGGRAVLGGVDAVSPRRGLELARRMRSGMTSVNSAISCAGMPRLPFGGVGDSGFGRIHGEDGLHELSRAKAITKRRMRSVLPALSFDRTPKTVNRIVAVVKLLHGRSR